MWLWLLGYLGVSLALAAVSAGPDEAAPANAKVVLEAVRRLKGADLETKPALKAAVDRLADQFQGQPEFVELVRDFRLTHRYPALLDFAVAHVTEPAAGEALQTLLLAQPTLVRTGLANSNQAPALVRMLGAIHQREAVPFLVPFLTNATSPTILQRAAVRSLVVTQDGATALLELARSGVLPKEVRPLAASELSTVRWVSIKTEAAKILPAPPVRIAKGESELPPVA